MTQIRVPTGLVLLALTAVAFAIRAYQLGYESFWFDEADAIRLASFEPVEQLEQLTRAATNGPLYFLLLRVWMLACGQSEFATRFLSLLAGVLTVPLLFVVGKRLAGTRAGLIAAWLGTFSSYLVFYSQETKMYSLFALVSLLACYLLLRSIADNEWLAWLGFMVFATIAFYIHVYGIMIVPTALILVIALSGRCRVSPVRAGAAFAGLTLPYLPLAIWQWQLFTDRGFRVEAYFSSIGLGGITNELLQKFTTRYAFLPDWATFALFGAVALIGLVPLGRGKTRPSDWLRTAYFVAFIGIPIGLSYLLVQRSGVFSDRYMIFVLPVYYLALGVGLDRIAGVRRGAMVTVVGLFLLLNAQPIADREVHGWATKEDWRAAVAYVEARSLPEDRFIFLAPEMRAGYAYYARQPFNTINLSGSAGQLGQEGVIREVQAAMAGGERLWVLVTHYQEEDAQTLLGALRNNLRATIEQGFWGLAVYRFETGPTSITAGPAPKTAISVNFENKVRLTGFTAQRALPDGDRMAIYSLYWEAMADDLPEYSVSLRILDRAGNVWAMNDEVPGGINYPTTVWQAGQVYRGDHDLAFPAGTPPGHYTLSVHLYERATLRELAVLTDGDVPSGTEAALSLMVLPAAAGSVTVEKQSPRKTSFQGRLRLEQVRLANQKIKPGEPFQLFVQWRKVVPIEGRPTANLSLVGSNGIAARWVVPLAQESYPPTAWKIGGPVAGIHKLYLPAATPGGRYSLRLSVSDDNDQEWRTGPWPYLWGSGGIEVGALEVQSRPQLYEAPSIASKTDVRFPAAGRLIGYEVALAAKTVDPRHARIAIRGGEALDVTLLWQAERTPDQDIIAFVHLLDSSGRVRAQHDGAPCGGDCRTRSWLEGEYLVDRHSLTVPVDAAPGLYRMAVGLYDSFTGQRLVDSEGQGQYVLTVLIEVAD